MKQPKFNLVTGVTCGVCQNIRRCVAVPISQGGERRMIRICANCLRHALKTTDIIDSEK
jgi:hypothetical protein